MEKGERVGEGTMGELWGREGEGIGREGAMGELWGREG